MISSVEALIDDWYDPTMNEMNAVCLLALTLVIRHIYSREYHKHSICWYGWWTHINNYKTETGHANYSLAMRLHSPKMLDEIWKWHVLLIYIRQDISIQYIWHVRHLGPFIN